MDPELIHQIAISLHTISAILTIFVVMYCFKFIYQMINTK